MVLASAVLPHPHGADLRSAPEPSLFGAVAPSSPFVLRWLRSSVCESPLPPQPPSVFIERRRTMSVCASGGRIRITTMLAAWSVAGVRGLP